MFQRLGQRLHLHPDAVISQQRLDDGKAALVRDAAWVSITGALSGGVVLTALALELGAGPFTIGVLGAIPFLAQAAQLPAIALVERVRQRKRIGVLTVTVARALILALALLPFLPGSTSPLAWLVAAQCVIAILGSVGACAINAWFHQLLPVQDLGPLFSRRLLMATGLAGVATLAAGLLVEHPPTGSRLDSFAIAFAVAGLTGFVSAYYLARCPEPVMEDAAPSVTLLAMLRAPFRDANFRKLLVLLGSWNLASNLVAPFLTVYLMRQLGYGLGTVTAMWVTSQIANAYTLYLWGRLSNRVSNKSILAVALPVYFACTLGLVFTHIGTPYGLQLWLLYGLHFLMGAASGSIGLATGNLGLKLAPRGRGTAHLAAVGLVSAVAGGVAPIVGGSLAQWFAERELSLIVRWVSPQRTHDVSVLDFAHWEFLFAVSAALGLYVLHALSRIQEGPETSERRVVQQLGLEALRTVNHLSTVAGVLGSVFSFGRLYERRAERRRRQRGGRGAGSDGRMGDRVRDGLHDGLGDPMRDVPGSPTGGPPL